MEIKSTSNLASIEGVKVCLYGDAGSGKTYQISTLERPLVVAAEKGLLTIQHYDIPYLQIDTRADWVEAKKVILDNRMNFRTIVMDSMTAFADMQLKEITEEMKQQKNKSEKQLGWDIYGELRRVLDETIEFFHCLHGMDSVLIFLSERITDTDSGRTSYVPSAGSDSYSLGLTAKFDEVLALRTKEDNGIFYRFIQTRDGDNYRAKDRSMTLLPTEYLTGSGADGSTAVYNTLGNLIQRMRNTAY